MRHRSTGNIVYLVLTYLAIRPSRLFVFFRVYRNRNDKTVRISRWSVRASSMLPNTVCNHVGIVTQSTALYGSLSYKKTLFRKIAANPKL